MKPRTERAFALLRGSRAASDVCVWGVEARVGESVFARLLSVLTPDEVVRAERFHFPSDRTQFVVTRGTLRCILGQYVGSPPRALVFERGSHGKPRLAPLADRPMPRFNVSHCDDRALIAVSVGMQVGVDVESIRPLRNMEELAVQVFSPSERSAFSALAPSQRTAGFFKGWASKEAYIKGVGWGLSLPLQEFEVSVDPAEPAELLRPYAAGDRAGHWSLHDLPVAGEYAAVLATETTPRRVIYREISASMDWGDEEAVAAAWLAAPMTR